MQSLQLLAFYCCLAFASKIVYIEILRVVHIFMQFGHGMFEAPWPAVTLQIWGALISIFTAGMLGWSVVRLKARQSGLTAKS